MKTEMINGVEVEVVDSLVANYLAAFSSIGFGLSSALAIHNFGKISWFNPKNQTLFNKIFGIGETYAKGWTRPIVFAGSGAALDVGYRLLKGDIKVWAMPAFMPWKARSLVR